MSREALCSHRPVLREDHVSLISSQAGKSGPEWMGTRRDYARHAQDMRNAQIGGSVLSLIIRRHSIAQCENGNASSIASQSHVENGKIPIRKVRWH